MAAGNAKAEDAPDCCAEEAEIAEASRRFRRGGGGRGGLRGARRAEQVAVPLDRGELGGVTKEGSPAAGEGSVLYARRFRRTASSRKKSFAKHSSTGITVMDPKSASVGYSPIS